ncbi:uncharacterized protein LOC129241355 [Anastrepha obliqua]|uniref:uncharacterized protein LOC129241355 n=1 Tax=Anastrepha obliqua TaxID=95512 RepID=UPI00240A3248|nr:uncharacterized protein LOC129241355 [Anastrepha obliqua]
MVRIRGVKCAISTDGHLLSGEGVLITNPKLLEFARKRRVDYRPENRVCAKCAKSLEQIYEYKIKRAIEKKNQRKSLTISSSSSLDDFDHLVYRTPRTKHLRDFVKQNAPFELRGPSQELIEVEEKEKENQDNNTSVPAIPPLNISDNTIISVGAEQHTRAPSPAAYEVLSISRDSPENATLDLRPSTSNAENNQVNEEPQQNNPLGSTAWRKPLEPAKRKTVRFDVQLQEDQSSATHTALQYDVTANLSASTTTDDEDFMPSLNAMNGTRLPHVQPIPRRRQFQHAIPTVQDIYMQGITGG